MRRVLKRILFTVAGLVAVPVVAVGALLLGGCSQLSTFNAVIPHDNGGGLVAEDIAYGPEERHRLDVYRPDAADAAPVLFFIYGGSWNSGSKTDYAFVGRAFAAQGFVTVIADYRLVPEVRYPDFVRDGARALAWARKSATRFGGDPEQIFLLGHSAGAYNAMMLALEPDFLDEVGLSPDAVTAAAGLSGPYDFLPLARDSTRAAFAHAPELEKTQPVNLVRQDAPPILLATGADDSLVGRKNIENLTARLKDAGIRHRSIVYPGVDHA
ncbi:MAG: alpha/beta hydrolase, partial [Pseudomonadota bacterium]